MNISHSVKGPLKHRLLVSAFSIAFGLLFYWLLGFIINDISTLKGPDYSDLEERMLDKKLVDEAEALDNQITETNRDIKEQQSRQKLLKDSIDNSQRTMDQLLDLQRLSLEKESELSPEAQEAMAENIQLFLSNQQRYQALNDQVSQLNEQLTELSGKQRKNNELLFEQRIPVQEEYEIQYERHNWKLAALKLAVLVPLLVIVVVLFLKSRGGTYGPLIYAAGIAVAAKVMLVMHEHFPERYFKYILIGASLVIVTRILVYLLRMVAFPKQDWLLKQYRDAYVAFFCPICDYPIRRGPLKFISWTRRSLLKISIRSPAAESKDQDNPYCCPMCSTQLFEECEKCLATRHSLLPTCEKCGATKSPDEDVVSNAL